VTRADLELLVATSFDGLLAAWRFRPTRMGPNDGSLCQMNAVFLKWPPLLAQSLTGEKWPTNPALVGWSRNRGNHNDSARHGVFPSLPIQILLFRSHFQPNGR
jgi:hypothetical protein